METPFPHLLSPIRIGGVTFRNRLFAAPTGLQACQDGGIAPTEEAIAHFESRAKAGAACVTCVGASIFPVDPSQRKAFWDIYDPLARNRMAYLARRIHLHGAKASMELGVAGVVARNMVVSEGAPTLWAVPGKEMTREDIQETVRGYADAAAAMVECGFDMVLLHFGHGLQVGQFLSPLYNRRTDEYGGSFENRCRFALEILDAIRARVGRRLLIEVRISGTEYEPGGIEIEEAIAFTRLIEGKADLVQFSAGIHGPRWMTTTHPCGFLPSIPNVWLAERAKKAGLNVPIAAIGGISDLAEAEGILAEGRADVLYCVRGLIADPQLMVKAYENRPDDVVPCVKCMHCHDSVVMGRQFHCTVNPRVGLENVLPEIGEKAKKPLRIAVIGGGPAGMQAALTACERGHAVTLYEQSGALGGALKFSDFVPFKYPLHNFKDYLVRQVEKSAVRVLLNTRATAETLAGGGYDVVIPALGAVPVVPPIPGLERARHATEIYGCEERVTGKTVLIGGGQVGCETALHLARLGKDVTIIEMRPELAPDATPTHRNELLFEMRSTPTLHLVTGVRCTAVTATAVEGIDAEGRAVSFPAETVLHAAGLRARSTDADGFFGSALRVLPIGDCTGPATVEQAVESAYYAVMSL